MEKLSVLKKLFERGTRYEITVSGLNIARLLEKIKKEGFSLFGIKKNNKTCTFCCLGRDKEQIVAILSNSLYNIILIKQYGVFSHLREKAIFAMGIATFFAVIFIANLFAYNCCFETEENHLFLLSDAAKITLPVRKNDAYLQSVQEKVKNSLDFSLCEASFVGNTLYVFALPSEKIIAEETDGISNFSGRLTKVIVLSGKANYNVGDTVKKGDVIISDVLFSETTGNSEKVIPMGKAYGITKITRSAVISKFELTHSLSEEKTKSWLEFFGKQINSGISEEIISSEEKVTSLFPLPIKIHKIKYKTFCEEQKDRDEEIFFRIEKIKEEITDEFDCDIVSVKQNVYENEQIIFIEVEAEIETLFCGG